MAKIVLSLDGVVLQEMKLSKERITIGRRPHNDLVINHSAISAEHAVIVTIFREAVLEDLNSTNGTRINGQPIKKHFLKHHDVIELAKYKIHFIEDVQTRSGEHIYSRQDPRQTHPDDLVIHSASRLERGKTHQDGNTVALTGLSGNPCAVIKILNGANAGKEITLTKPLTTIGLPGQQVAVITCRGQAYSLTHVEGDAYPLVNGQSIGASAYLLTDGDAIELIDTTIVFSLL